MALFDFSKKKKEEGMPAPPNVQSPSGVPVDQIMTMTQQGYTNDQIVQNLQSQGFNSSQIQDALTQVNMNQQAPPQMPPGSQMPEPPPIDQPFPMPDQQQPFPEPQQPAYPQQQSYSEQLEESTAAPAVTDKERIEELAEVIIEEKWKELVSDVDKIIEWKDKTESRVSRIEQGLMDLKQAIESLNKSLISKISDYDKNIENVGVEIKAMEKVFQKVLPSLTDNVNRLERIGKKTK